MPIYKNVVQKLPVLDEMLKVVFENKYLTFKNIAIVGVQHMLFTTASLINSFMRLGVQPSNIYLLGKHYSRSEKVVNYFNSIGVNYLEDLPISKLGNFSNNFTMLNSKLWELFISSLENKNGIDAVIVLDDGADCITSVPVSITKSIPIIGVEQTTSGIKNPKISDLNFPVIEVASSAVKQYLESPMIAQAVIKKLDSVLELYQKKLQCGVAGLGVIGMSVVKKLREMGHEIFTFDKDIMKNIKIKNTNQLFSLEDLFKQSQYVFGCTGEDITENINFNKIIAGDKCFVSCSSKDTEYLSLLKLIQESNSYDECDVIEDVHHKTENGYIKILRGGFPINLDHSGESVIARDIQLTRGLLLGGVLQGIMNISKSKGHVQYMLDPIIQKFVVSKWRKYGSMEQYSPEILGKYEDTTWIMANSGGYYQPCDYFTQNFSISDLIIPALS